MHCILTSPHKGLGLIFSFLPDVGNRFGVEIVGIIKIIKGVML